ncbi:MAG: choice-of-anchor D domain-containing protein [Acidobacteriota bacterium]
MRSSWVLWVLAACGRYGFSGGSLTADRASIDFDALPCGGSSSIVVTLTNGGDTAVAFTAVVDVPGVSATPADGTVPPGGSASLTLAATAAAVATPGEAMSGELVLDTDDPAIGQLSVPVSVTTTGGVLAADATTLDFGEVGVSTMHSQMVTLSNTGTAMVSVMTGTFTTPFSITSSPAFDLAPGASQPVVVGFDPPANQGYSYQLPLVVSGPTCGPVPLVQVTGVGSSSPVLLDHTTVDFGDVTCGAAAASITVNMTNANATSYSYTAGITAGSTFGVSPTSGSVPASGSASVDVSRGAVTIPATPGAVSGNLNVAVTGNGTTNVPLSYTVSGAVVSSSAPSVRFSTSSGQQSVTITNSGNQNASLTVTRTGSSLFSAPTSFQVGPGSMATLTVSYAGGLNVASADFAIAATNLCSTALTIHASGGDN